jgi:hypothetical protein
MAANPLVSGLLQVQDRFDRSTACLEAEDSAFTPVEGTFTMAQQVEQVG